jgi:hypothetical protein
MANAVETGGSSSGNLGKNVTAGPGLREETTEVVNELLLGVGAGAGITVNANDVNVDITNQTFSEATLEDEVLISKPSENNTIKKTRVRDIAVLASNPGGTGTQVQYNDGGVFGADSGFTYDGAGNVNITGTLTLEGVSIAGGAVDTIRFDGNTGSSDARIQSLGDGGYSLKTGSASLNNGSIQFLSAPNASSNTILFLVGPNGQISIGDNAYSGSGIAIAALPLRRSFVTNIIASTTQTQGNGPLTNDYNNVITVANANDSVTLPVALSARYCMVRNSGANILQIYPASGDNLGEGVNISTTLLPGAIKSWFAIDVTTWYQVDGPVRYSVEASITASTTQTQGQKPLTRDVNEISVVANINDTVTLPPAEAVSRTVTIINNGANTLKIYPASGDNLGTGLNTSTTLAAGSNVRYTNYNVTNWEIV